MDDENWYFGVVAGKMQDLPIGISCKLTATIELNKKYNTYQFKPISIIAERPTTTHDQEQFLRTIVTEHQTEILLNAYPNIVDDIINDREIDLNKTRGIKEFTFNKIKNKVIDNFVIADLLILLQPLGVTINMIKKLTTYEKNPELLKQKLYKNPYILTEINGLGFKKVDDLALKINPEIKVSLERTVAYINYIFEEVGNGDGHTWIEFNDLNRNMKNNLGECYEIFMELMNDPFKYNKFLSYDKNKRVGLAKNFITEHEIYKKLNDINDCDTNFNLDVEGAIERAEISQGFKYTEEQKDAIRSANDNNVVLVTGSAGVGKTVILKGMLEVFKDYSIGMCALSAKASQRIKEVTGFDAMTIHRLLGYGGSDEGYDEKNPLPYDVVILDEASMVNIDIFLWLIKAIKPSAKLILAFDFAQLPPIGVGNPATDLLGLNFKVNKFTKIHRQAEKSGILVDANKIRVGINPVKSPDKHIISGELKDMHYMFRDSRDSLNRIAINSFMKAIESGTHTLDEIVIIVPRKQDCLNSTNEINKIIQDRLIPDTVPMLHRGDMKFKLGAKVIQRINDYEKGIFNGEIGYITNIYINKGDDVKGDFVVTFGDKVIEFNKIDLNNMELAYALTCHSCQGSQYKRVICIIDNTHHILLTNELLYTMITRAMKDCLLLAEGTAFLKCIRTNAKERQTYLQYMKVEKE